MSEYLYYVKGINGQLTVYDDRIEIGRKGILAYSTHGLAGNKMIPMSSIQSVQFKRGGPMFNGFIQFGVLGGNESRGGVMNATVDENTVLLRMGEQSDIGEEIKNFVEKKILERSTPQQPISTVVNQSSAADEVMKMKQLLDMGAITQEEFDKKKKELLGL